MISNRLLSIALLFVVSTSTAFDCGSRVRKSYDKLTPSEKGLYRRALSLSMDKGYYIKFVEAHTEMKSEKDAHRVCMFTYWHRYLLLGFENMLRSLGDEFKCITIPYWDEIQHSANLLSGKCNSIENCSSIVRDWGGSTIGKQTDIKINGILTGGNVCATKVPLNHFCQASSTPKAQCVKCVPRGDIKNKIFPAASSYVSIYRQLLTPSDFSSAVKSIEDGMHNTLHATLEGAMSTFQAPADPLFFSHHAFVDLLFTTYLKCNVGLGVLTNDKKKSNLHAFAGCAHRDDAGTGNYTTSSTVTMRSGEGGRKPMTVFKTGQALYPFFKDIPSYYYQLADITTLGVDSYSYEFQGLVAQLHDKCDAAPENARARRLQTIATSTHLRCYVSANDTESEEITSDVIHSESTSQNPVDVADIAPSPPPEMTEEVVQNMNNWVGSVVEKLDNSAHAGDPSPSPSIAEELEKMMCMFYDECHGGIKDYSESFKKAFHVTEPPPCKVIVDAIRSNQISLQLDNWRDIMEDYFPCNESTKAQQSYGSNDEGFSQSSDRDIYEGSMSASSLYG